MPDYCQVIKQRVTILKNRLSTFCWGFGGLLHMVSPLLPGVGVTDGHSRGTAYPAGNLGRPRNRGQQQVEVSV